jgi:triosephosphate isomerase (TIM)
MLLVANWKAYVEDARKAKELFVLSKRLSRTTKNVLVLAPPAVFLASLSSGNTSAVQFSAQDVSTSTGGAATGEIVAEAYVAAGATYAIVGHSERRARGDTNAAVAEKLQHALAHGLIPILCIGEQERDGDGRYLSLLREQLSTALVGLSLKERQRVVIAYEPIWAINKTAALSIDPRDLSEIVLYIRKVLGDFLIGKNSLRIPLLYGGSVEPSNARILAGSASIDGFLIGHASVDPRLFRELVKALS